MAPNILFRLNTDLFSLWAIPEAYVMCLSLLTGKGGCHKANVVLRSELKEEGYHLPCLRAHICLRAHMHTWLPAQGRAGDGGPVLLGLPAAHPAAGRQPPAPPALLERVLHPLLRWQALCLHHTVKDSGIKL